MRPYFLVLSRGHMCFATVLEQVPETKRENNVRIVRSTREPDTLFVKANNRELLTQALSSAFLGDLEPRKVRTGWAATLTPDDLPFGEWGVVVRGLRRGEMHIVNLDRAFMMMPLLFSMSFAQGFA